MFILVILLLLVSLAFAIEEFVLIKPASTIEQSDPISRRLEMMAIWIPAIGWGTTAATLVIFGGVRLDGVINGTGLALCMAGLALRYWSRRTLGGFFTIGVVKQKGHRVIREGPYGSVRHPAYLAFLFFYLGLPLLIGNWFGLLFLSLPAFIVFILLINVEDKYLAEGLGGSDYQDYRKHSARLVPGIW